MRISRTFIIAILMLLLVSASVYAEDAKINISGYTQFQANISSDTAGSPSTFRIRRARLKFDGKANEKISYTLLLDACTPLLWEAVIDIKINRFANVRAGQFKAPYSAEYLTSSAKLETIEASNGNGKITKKYDVGAAFYGKAGIADYTVALVNGAGQNAVDANMPKDLAARVVITPVKNLEAGLSCYYGTPAVNTWESLYAVNLGAKISKLALKAEALIKDTKTIDENSFYLVATYDLIKQLQLVLLGENYSKATTVGSTTTTSSDMRILAGLNWFISNNVKYQLNVVNSSQKTPDKSVTMAFAQMQINY